MAPGVTHEDDPNVYDTLDSERNSATNTPDKTELKAIRFAYKDPKSSYLEMIEKHATDLYDDFDNKSNLRHDDKAGTQFESANSGGEQMNCSVPEIVKNGQLKSDLDKVNMDKSTEEIMDEHEHSYSDEENANEYIDDHDDELEQTEADVLLQNKAVDTTNKDDDYGNRDVDDEIVEETTKAPDGGWGWFIILGALLLRMIIGGMGRSHGLFYIKFRERYDGSATATAFVTSLTGIFRLGGGLFVSILCTRFKCRYLTVIGACLLSIGLVVTGFSPSLEFLYFSYGVICGLGRAFALTPIPILLGYYFDKKRSIAFGLASAGFSLGGFGITPTVEIFFQTFGFRGTFLLLSGFALNILVCAALFRPISLHRKITQKRSRNQTDEENADKLIVRSIEHMESGQILSTSTISIERIRTYSRSTSRDSYYSAHGHQDFEHDTNNLRKHVTDKVLIKSKTSKHSDMEDKLKQSSETDKNELNDTQVDKQPKSLENNDKDRSKENGYVCHEGESNKDDQTEDTDSAKETKEEREKKPPLIAWSILKDVRFLCLCLSNFLLTLPNTLLFLPSLALARGASEIEAATLLSINAGSDTVFRVISGFILDLKIFRGFRPQIYSAAIVMHGVINMLYPLMYSYTGFVSLCLIDGIFSGMKAAQNSVVVMDILGVDKLASSMTITMSIQVLAILIGPTVSGQLKDTSGVYDGAFYFGGGAIILGGLVMVGGNIRKCVTDRRKKRDDEKTEDESALTQTV